MAIELGKGAIRFQYMRDQRSTTTVQQQMGLQPFWQISIIGSIPYGLVTMHHALQGKRMHMQPSRLTPYALII